MVVSETMNSSRDVIAVDRAFVLTRIDDQIAEIQRKITELQDDPANKGKPGSIWKYTQKTHKKLDKLAMSIAILMAEKRAILGNPVPCSGYSGRQTNQR